MCHVKVDCVNKMRKFAHQRDLYLQVKFSVQLLILALGREKVIPDNSTILPLPLRVMISQVPELLLFLLSVHELFFDETMDNYQKKVKHIVRMSI